MKRMYVDDAGRGHGVGWALGEAVVQRARDLGYAVVRLDTSVEQHEAIGLYRSLGFRQVEAYHPVPDALRDWLVFFAACEASRSHRRRRGAAAATVQGCGAGDRLRDRRADAPDTGPVRVGTSTRGIVVDGALRTFRVHRPASLPDPAPLVVMLHGGFGSAEQAEDAYGWDAQAERGGFLVAYPDGLGRAWNTVGGGCCGQPAKRGVDDVAFISAMVRRIQDQSAIDPRRIYATGISNGGIMAYRLACAHDPFAAIGPSRRPRLGGARSRARVSLIHIHGPPTRASPTTAAPGEGVARIDGPPVPRVVAGWRRSTAAPRRPPTAGPVDHDDGDLPGRPRRRAASPSPEPATSGRAASAPGRGPTHPRKRSTPRR